MFDLVDFCRRCAVPNTGKFLRQCEVLLRLLRKANEIHNLTRITQPEDFQLKHLADSLLIALECPELVSRKIFVADIGCGAGFPSLILALAFPRWEISAIDSTGKKIDFVRSAAQTLELRNLAAIKGRAVELNRQKIFQRRFDLVTARAVGTIQKIASESSRFLNDSGFYCFYKTPSQADEELPSLAGDKIFQWSRGKTYCLPHGERCFIQGKRK